MTKRTLPRHSIVADYIRSNAQQISDTWERIILQQQKELTPLDRAALMDHLPEVLNGLASWVEGKTGEAEVSFKALADGHALQRLGFGIELASVNSEYALLRSVILRGLLAIPSDDETREDLITFNEGLDRAIHFSVRRYTEHRDYLRGRFIGILGHDLRNPATAIRVGAEVLLRSKTAGEPDRENARTLISAASRMERMIDDVLDFARGHLGGGIPAEPRQCDMAEICRTAVEEVRKAHPERTLRLETRGDLAGTFDRDRVLQALGNLLSNAVQYGEDPVTLEASETDDRQTVVTRVTNRGKAIPASLLPRIFDPFAHAGQQGKGSLGLGLFITAQIARAHGGICRVTSDDNETSFMIRWPRVPREQVSDRP